MKHWQWIAISTLWVLTQALRPAAGTEQPAAKGGSDSRLVMKVTLREKGIALSDFCADLQKQTGVELTASRAVADEKVTVFVDERPAREVMREVARLFGFFWQRSGHDGAYRYELDQDLRSQLAEEELRNHDLDAALMALDAQMQKYRPYLDASVEELQQRLRQDPTLIPILVDPALNGNWGAMQLYFRLTPPDRAALASGQELVFRPDAANPDRRLPPEWNWPILLSKFPGHPVEKADVRDRTINQIRVKLNRSELGQVSLNFTTSEVWPGSRTYWEWEPATGRGPAVADPDNAAINAKLRGKAPFDETVSLRPEPSCPPVKDLYPNHVEPWLGSVLSNRDLSRACATSADVWEAVHHATGLPIVADFYTHLFPVGKLMVEHGTLFHALCQVGDAIGVRWTMDGPFLLCRSTSYFWDKLKEVPNRCLQRWARDRDANHGLPFADFLEMAGMTDEQLDSSVVADGIDRLWKLPEWAILNYRPTRHSARYLASLTPEQLRRALQPDGLPFPSLGPSQQEGAMKMQFEALAEMERAGGAPTPIPAEMWSHAFVGAKYIPAGSYAWLPQPDDIYGPAGPIGGRTPAEALAAVRRLYPPARAQDVKYCRTGWFSGGITFFFRNK